MEKLISLLCLTPQELKTQLCVELKKARMDPISEDGYLYAEGDIPVLLVAHMDTVFDVPRALNYDKKEGVLFNAQGGLGADDRAGVYAILDLLKSFRPHILFLEDEEIGCVGAQKAIKTLKKPPVKYIIEFDRMGRDDCVFYECGNQEFIKYVESFGFIKNSGSYTDISILGSAWDIASVNLSVGYYFEHTSVEYLVLNYLALTISRTQKMLKQIDKAPYFDYQYDENLSNGFVTQKRCDYLRMIAKENEAKKK